MGRRNAILTLLGLLRGTSNDLRSLIHNLEDHPECFVSSYELVSGKSAELNFAPDEMLPSRRETGPSFTDLTVGADFNIGIFARFFANYAGNKLHFTQNSTFCSLAWTEKEPPSSDLILRPDLTPSQREDFQQLNDGNQWPHFHNFLGSFKSDINNWTSLDINKREETCFKWIRDYLLFEEWPKYSETYLNNKKKLSSQYIFMAHATIFRGGYPSASEVSAQIRLVMLHDQKVGRNLFSEPNPSCKSAKWLVPGSKGADVKVSNTWFEQKYCRIYQQERFLVNKEGRMLTKRNVAHLHPINKSNPLDGSLKNIPAELKSLFSMYK